MKAIKGLWWMGVACSLIAVFILRFANLWSALESSSWTTAASSIGVHPVLGGASRAINNNTIQDDSSWNPKQILSVYLVPPPKPSSKYDKKLTYSQRIQKTYSSTFSRKNLPFNHSHFHGSQWLPLTEDAHCQHCVWYFTRQAVHEHGVIIANELIASLHVRFERLGKKYNATFPNAMAVQHVMEHDDWSIIYKDATDRTTIPFIMTYLNHNIIQYLGKNTSRLFQWTRSIASNPFRKMDYYHRLPWNTTFRSYDLGGSYNFSTLIHDQHCLGGVKQYTYPVREDLVDALHSEFIKRQRVLSVPSSSSNSNNSAPTSLAMVTSRRPIQVASFWNVDDTSRSSFLRSVVSQAVAHTCKMQKLSCMTRIVGHKGADGRHAVHLDYVRALLDVQIVVVAQRDRWEDHFRFLEGMVSGALVLTDPMTSSFPPGFQNGTHMMVYSSVQDLQDKILYFVNHEEERQAIALSGRELALQRHRLHHRYEQLVYGDWSVRNEYRVSILN